MAFRFRLNEPPQKGFRRIGLEQIERAQRQLALDGDPDVAVHETRKCLKRIRALLRLVHPGLDDAHFRAENARVRDIAALLAPARDRHIVSETLGRLQSLYGQRAHPALASLKAIVVEDLDQARNGGSSHVEEALEKLETAKKRFRRLSLVPADFSPIERGLENCYRKARRAFRAAYATNDDEAFHEWRKWVQQHWRHMALLSRAWPDHFEARIRAARALSQILGEDHDLHLVAAYGPSLPPSRFPRKHVRDVARIVAARQKELRQMAAPRGLQLFSEGAKGHAHRVAEMWAAAEEIGEHEEEAAPIRAQPTPEKPAAVKIRA
jgi:CHAD domain-containing protein